jgi:hypothetical protein
VRSDELRVLYTSLVVTSCEWRTIGVADADDLAQRVLTRLERQPQADLADLYREVEKVVQLAFEEYSDRLGILEKFRNLGTAPPARPTRLMLDALSTLNTRDRALLQRRYWDELDALELAESLRWPVEQAVARLARAEAKFYAKARRKRPELDASEVPALIVSLKPGERRRYRSR